MKKRPGELFADHLMLELAVVFNCLHFLILLTASLLDHRKYLYFSLAFTSAGKLGELVQFVVLFLMPSILAVVFALLLNAVSKKPAWLRNLVTAASAVSILGFMVYAVVCSAVFPSMMPFASHTAKAENFGRYDETVMANVPTSNCPVSITELPEGAQDFRYSYTYVSIIDEEWRVRASWSLPQKDYGARKAEMLSSLNSACGAIVTQEDGAVRATTGDYVGAFGKARTLLTLTFRDETREVSYDLQAFVPSGG